MLQGLFHRCLPGVVSVLLVLHIIFELTIAIEEKSSISHNLVAAINCGGKEHVDIHGIRYKGDQQKMGVASDYGSRLVIGRVAMEDMILYQTERYHFDDFSYEIDLPMTDADYVLVLKFAEVYFRAPQQKVFDVLLNGEMIIPGLDIFARSGLGIALDEIIPIKIKDHRLHLSERVIQFDGKLKITLAKGEHDNPKLNAFYIVRGVPEDIPEMPSLVREEEENEEDQRKVQEVEEEEMVVEKKEKAARRLAAGPAVADPYDVQDSTHLLPILVAVAAFLPLLFCLCKL